MQLYNNNNNMNIRSLSTPTVVACFSSSLDLFVYADIVVDSKRSIWNYDRTGSGFERHLRQAPTALICVLDLST